MVVNGCRFQGAEFPKDSKIQLWKVLKIDGTSCLSVVVHIGQ